VTKRLTPSLALGWVVLALSMNVAAAGESLAQQGRVLAERMCAGCHAIDKTGSSPHAAAPTFREIGRRVDLDNLTNRLREGLTSGHPDMPTFRFTREDARALIAYLRSIQAH